MPANTWHPRNPHILAVVNPATILDAFPLHAQQITEWQ